MTVTDCPAAKMEKLLRSMTRNRPATQPPLMGAQASFRFQSAYYQRDWAVAQPHRIGDADNADRPPGIDGT